MAQNINTLSPGDIVYLEESGKLTPYIFLQYNHYSSSEVTLLRKYTYATTTQFRAAGFNQYNGSDVDNLCTTHKSKLSTSVQSKLKNVSIPVAAGASSSGATPSSSITNLSRSCFLLSMTEYGLTGWTTEGTQFAAANANRIAYSESAIGTAVDRWGRSPDSTANNACIVNANGTTSSGRVTDSNYFRPALTLQSGIFVSSYNDGFRITTGTLWIKVNGSWKEIADAY